MRTTVTLDDDTTLLVRTRMQERGVSFEQALNELLREGAPAGRRPSPFVTETASLGRPVAGLDRALQIVGDVEDDELVRRICSGS